MKTKKKIFVAGHRGMVGSALVRILKSRKKKVITKDKKELNLLNQQDVFNFFKKNKIDQVYLAAAKVGGIYANNNYPAEFIYQNLTIQNNVIQGAFLGGVKKLLFFGSSCIYPKNLKHPIKEEHLLSSYLEPTNEPYAIAKIAGLKMCQSYNRQYGESNGIDYRCIMPSNLYGPGDNYHPINSHVIPGLIYRFHHAKLKNLPHVYLWGSGKPKREFLYVDDMANASIMVMNMSKKKFNSNNPFNLSHINIGSGNEITIIKLAKLIKKIVNFKGKILFNNNKLDGTNKKLLDCSRINNLGFKDKINLEKGLRKTYKSYIKNNEKI